MVNENLVVPTTSQTLVAFDSESKAFSNYAFGRGACENRVDEAESVGDITVERAY